MFMFLFKLLLNRLIRFLHELSMFDVESWFVVSESEVIYLLIFQTQETSAKTKSGR